MHYSIVEILMTKVETFLPCWEFLSFVLLLILNVPRHNWQIKMLQTKFLMLMQLNYPKFGLRIDCFYSIVPTTILE